MHLNATIDWVEHHALPTHAELGRLKCRRGVVVVVRAAAAAAAVAVVGKTLGPADINVPILST